MNDDPVFVVDDKHDEVTCQKCLEAAHDSNEFGFTTMGIINNRLRQLRREVVHALKGDGNVWCLEPRHHAAGSEWLNITCMECLQECLQAPQDVFSTATKKQIKEQMSKIGAGLVD